MVTKEKMRKVSEDMDVREEIKKRVEMHINPIQRKIEEAMKFWSKSVVRDSYYNFKWPVTINMGEVEDEKLIWFDRRGVKHTMSIKKAEMTIKALQKKHLDWDISYSIVPAPGKFIHISPTTPKGPYHHKELHVEIAPKRRGLAKSKKMRDLERTIPSKVKKTNK